MREMRRWRQANNQDDTPHRGTAWPAADTPLTSYDRPYLATPAPGDRIDDYRVEKKLGQGATGHVFKAVGLRGPLRNKVVAIKIIKKSLLHSAKRKQRVAEEIAVHRDLPAHPAIVRFEHTFEDEEHIYICTEYCSGSTVFAFLQENYPTGLSEAQAGPTFLSLVQAVSFMHLNEVMHRDLKLSNVLLTDTLQVKIADFGLATKLRDADADQDMTMCGTPNYISPEIVNRLPYGIASDVWSLGCILVALLTGKPPFQGDQISETLRLVAKGAYRPLPRGVSRDVKSLVDAILQIDPERRLTTAEMMAHPFLAAAAQRDMTISPLSPSYGMGPQSPQRAAETMPADLGVAYHTPGRKGDLANMLNRERPKLSDLLGKTQRQGYAHMVEQQRRPSFERGGQAWPVPEVGDLRPQRQAPSRRSTERETTYDDTQGFTKHREMLPPLEAPTRPTSSHRRARSAADLEMEPRQRYWPREQEAFYQDNYRRNGRRTRFGYALREEEYGREVRKSRSFGASKPLAEAYQTTGDAIETPRMEHMKHTRPFDLVERSPPRTVQEPVRARFGMEPLQNVVEEILKEDEAREMEDKMQWEKQSQSGSRSTDDPALAVVTKYQFSTVGLKAAAQSSKYGELAILEDGRVSIALANGGQTYHISADGQTISLVTSGVEQCFHLADLPARHLLAYRYASKFVNLVRSKTVRIAINAAEARSRLYENDGFEVVLIAEGRKVAFDPVTRTVKVADKEQVLYKGSVDCVDAHVRDSVRLAMMWYARCFEALGAEIGASSSWSPSHQENGTLSEKVETKFLEGIGWCEKRQAGKEWVFYLLDGTCLELDTSSKTCSLENKKLGISEQHALEVRLPRHVRHRLKLASAAMKQFV